MVLRSAHALHALTVGRAAGVDDLRHVSGAYEADSLDVRMVRDGLHDLSAALHDVEDSLGQASLERQFGEAHGNGRITLGGLEDEGVADGQGRRQHPERDHGREVERRDARYDAKRLADRVNVDARSGAFGELALQQVRHATDEFDHFQAALQVADGVSEHLAVL